MGGSFPTNSEILKSAPNSLLILSKILRLNFAVIPLVSLYALNKTLLSFFRSRINNINPENYGLGTNNQTVPEGLIFEQIISSVVSSVIESQLNP